MGSKSKSKSASTSTTTSNVKTNNLAFEDIDGITVVGEGNRLTVTDGGAFDLVENMGAGVVRAAENISGGAFKLANEFGAGAFDLAESYGDQFNDLSGDVFGFAGEAIDYIDESGKRSLDTVTRSVESSLQKINESNQNETEALASKAVVVAGIAAAAYVAVKVLK